MPRDALDVVLDVQIAAAKEAIVSLARQDPSHWWTPFELKKKARNGWSASTMGLAFFERRRLTRPRR
jgi:hypothetical protein